MTNLSVVNDKFVINCAMREPSVEADDSGLIEMGERIAMLVERMGMQNAVEVAGKSDRQLKRYAAGAEPPFGVLKALIDRADASFDWVAAGRARTRVDHELSLAHHRKKVPMLERELLTDLSDGNRADVEELLAVTQHLIVVEEQLLENRAWRSTDDSSSTSQPTVPAQSDMIRLPLYSEVHASAGPGSVPASELADGIMALDRRFLRDQGAVPDQCVVIWARGDSMTPTFPDGSALVVDRSQIEIADGCIMVLNVADSLLVKRVQRLTTGEVRLISDNRNYEPQTLAPHQLDQLRIIGRVVWFGRTP